MNMYQDPTETLTKEDAPNASTFVETCTNAPHSSRTHATCIDENITTVEIHVFLSICSFCECVSGSYRGANRACNYE
jgi:hypothetical protein